MCPWPAQVSAGQFLDQQLLFSPGRPTTSTTTSRRAKWALITRFPPPAATRPNFNSNALETIFCRLFFSVLVEVLPLRVRRQKRGTKINHISLGPGTNPNPPLPPWCGPRFEDVKPKIFGVLRNWISVAVHVRAVSAPSSESGRRRRCRSSKIQFQVPPAATWPERERERGPKRDKLRDDGEFFFCFEGFLVDRHHCAVMTMLGLGRGHVHDHPSADLQCVPKFGSGLPQEYWNWGYAILAFEVTA